MAIMTNFLFICTISYSSKTLSLNKFYENEKKLEITEYDDELLKKAIQHYDKIYEISLNGLPKNSQKIFKMVQISRKDISRFVSNKNVPYFLAQMDIHFRYHHLC